ncbi:hypothetical protein COM21_08665 [Bacillus toyonensis]|uniref:DUF3959 family protein n=1 Tax=Bacillus toyonensis TaxID=155322 RepID=A0A2C4NTW2_9BACI|nr:DUF3959 family protein [Bacillus toyonensis]MBC2684657.1 DUF3959 family protein [Bacillus toyonensis]MBH0359278.1 DUF3959 domain-containing protein [Bacillus toyonensis biovar Thuringiensis]MCH5453358.1 DUF3959 family protein [Bacillus toyonensis]MED2711135.1 DUF3959 family protein [Bacillus toyonensis]MED2742529.1 DUF3959 family protein [Bacillus toyonensis]
MKKLDVLLMLLSGLFPIAGMLKQIPLEQSLYIGGLLFFTSFGSYFAKKIYSRICSWIAYAPFITLLLVIWNQDISTSAIIANAKIAACIALIPCIFRFRTYGLTLGLFSLWAALLWDIKEVQSLVILERMTSLMTSNYVYLLLLAGGLILGGLLATLIHRKEKDNNKENINLFHQKKKRKKLSFKMPLPRLPKFKMKLFKFGGKGSKRKTPEKIRKHNYEESAPAATYEMSEQIDQYKEDTVQGQTRMERRKNRYNA